MKIKVGILFKYDEDWIGGTYYFVNLINSLNHVSVEKKPEIHVFSNERDFISLYKSTNYEFLIFHDFKKSQHTKIERFINKVVFKIFNKQIFQREYNGDLDVLFSNQISSYFNRLTVKKKLFWIPDFQFKYYPEFYSENSLNRMNERLNWLSLNASNLVFSSYSSKRDWLNFYSKYKGKVNVLNFAVYHPEYESIDLKVLLTKYNLPETYFFSPNQFWIHKNHITVIKAVEVLRNKGQNICVVFSGK
jgi:hypothetical protein